MANLQAGKAKIDGSQVKNGQGELVAVVHQYDRRRDLQDQYFQDYLFWDHESEAAQKCRCGS